MQTTSKRKRPAAPSLDQREVQPKKQEKQPRPHKSWRTVIPTMSDPQLTAELYRLDCLDNGRPDPKGTYATTTAEGGHKFLTNKKTGAWVNQYRSLATYNVFEDCRWFASAYPDLQADLVTFKGSLPVGPPLAAALTAFKAHVVGSGRGQSEKATRHNCPYSLKKTVNAAGVAVNASGQQVCFSAQCINNPVPGSGPYNARVANEVDKHFHYFLHSKDPAIKAGAMQAFGPGGPLEGAYRAHFGRDLR